MKDYNLHVKALVFMFLVMMPFQWSRPAHCSESGAPVITVAIHCSLNLLQVWNGSTLIKEYPVETGKGGLGKKSSGDHKTPIGDYKISWMASKHSDKGSKIVDNRSWCLRNEFVDAASGPPLEKLWAEPYGGDEATVMSINYPNEADLAKGYTGDCIHIHADKRHDDGVLKKSYGCIHMFPKDAKELYDMVEVGTPVKMLP
jgi:lipoprotein-anchoring transpeptidase ErfK/SrfK